MPLIQAAKHTCNAFVYPTATHLQLLSSSSLSTHLRFCLAGTFTTHLQGFPSLLPRTHLHHLPCSPPNIHLLFYSSCTFQHTHTKLSPAFSFFPFFLFLLSCMPTLTLTPSALPSLPSALPLSIYLVALQYYRFFPPSLPLASLPINLFCLPLPLPTFLPLSPFPPSSSAFQPRRSCCCFVVQAKRLIIF